ncbi:UDP-N-acetylglucosamine 2-epimerase (non-hydrolysing) [Desulfacinum hydrothermale DSM 13146]|uniref:UDP-N-acetylglucosamine 2-epimerase (Non-hydrolysing) n=1 Tax=Desulfacinum hydrothermale DSM 13146 TaxID=1121390 RepID=A0A1W1XS98_9BACT|nr:UDP-N-acetylglucosamine 2-epimerase (non-hydrolyzing) [Desulfacinum hydrothermale]SMC26722.1 UDP-N-acetylglucosamine 2-epimerase (non-hydrolysing) [Desulfacinum hydrothermale DSM 13146]
MNVCVIAGARPNFMKAAPILRAARAYPQARCRLVHTGQHYDYQMSEAFFRDLEIPRPDHFLQAGSGSHAEQTARIMTAFEQVCQRDRPDLVLVVGDVNSTLACSITAKKLGIAVAHVEAGLRSFDLTMPEEINRLVTDSITDYFFCTEQSAVENLRREGKPQERIFFVGHVMIDNLFHQLKQLQNGGARSLKTAPLKAQLGTYNFLTLHRPANVDDPNRLRELAATLNEIAQDRPILFPVHPRTQKMLERYHIRFSHRVHLLPPLGFREALYLWKDARVVLTDSGGLQEETTALGVPCVTLRENTERPVTIQIGSNVLGGVTRQSILDAYTRQRDRERKAFSVPPLWDGKAAERIWKALEKVGHQLIR